VTYEASNYYYTYSAAIFRVQSNGEIDTKLDIASIDIRKYSDWYDYLRAVGEGIFLIIIIIMFYSFIKRKIRILKLYSQWEYMEISHLTKIEKEQRRKNRPEIFRKAWSLVDFFSVFEFFFFILILI